jgi:hypothetical protein
VLHKEKPLKQCESHMFAFISANTTGRTFLNHIESFVSKKRKTMLMPQQATVNWSACGLRVEHEGENLTWNFVNQQFGAKISMEQEILR